ncbi:hypothetical protein Pcinc_007122 [Petrolisthes cinctipes]|uniref:Uncharacterized protein n=1 Tax=Petrolisthes cinctipes TaxID=88211 RepID=A0AAE1GBM3_PETCI|nr:hypothetical protein Pcinc_015658 [Petrolisthes cinctipes]KAK3888856.1 hypothetical protein Pcinc_007122 [Petrolisthes cinctipes]
MTERCVSEALGESGVAAVVMDERIWWQHLEHHLSYTQYSQHILIGHHAWITSVMKKRHSVPLTFTHTNVTRPASASNYNDLSAAFATLSGTITEVTKGIMLTVVLGTGRTKENLSLESTAQLKLLDSRWVAVGSLEAGGDGRWQVVQAAEWTKQGGLRVFKPLWSSPSFNFHQRLVRFACSKVSIITNM